MPSRVFNDLPGSQNYKSPSGLPRPHPVDPSVHNISKRGRWSGAPDTATARGNGGVVGLGSRRRAICHGRIHGDRIITPRPAAGFEITALFPRLRTAPPPPPRTRAPYTAPYIEANTSAIPSEYTLSPRSQHRAGHGTLGGKSEKTAAGTVVGFVSLTPFFFSLYIISCSGTPDTTMACSDFFLGISEIRKNG